MGFDGVEAIACPDLWSLNGFPRPKASDTCILGVCSLNGLFVRMFPLCARQAHA